MKEVERANASLMSELNELTDDNMLNSEDHGEEESVLIGFEQMEMENATVQTDMKNMTQGEQRQDVSCVLVYLVCACNCQYPI